MKKFLPPKPSPYRIFDFLIPNHLRSLPSRYKIIFAITEIVLVFIGLYIVIIFIR